YSGSTPDPAPRQADRKPLPVPRLRAQRLERARVLSPHLERPIDQRELVGHSPESERARQSFMEHDRARRAPHGAPTGLCRRTEVNAGRLARRHDLRRSVGPHIADTRDVADERSPFRGLGFYTEADAKWFFGRTTERKIILSHLRTARLTLL